jgi:hypothetical protein
MTAFLVLTTVAGGLLGLAALRFGVRGPALFLAGGVLVFLVIEALRGWPDTLFPLLGGSALDGARFYGMPNVDSGLLLGAALWVAAWIGLRGGFFLLVGAGLFAGFPDLGADLGGALTCFFAAGLWLWLGMKRPWWQGALLVGAVVAIGMAAVLAANVWLASSPTHATALVEHGGGSGGIVHHVLDRLAIGWRLLLLSPFSWIPVLGLFVALAFLLRPTPVLRAGFERHPSWHRALLTLVLASMVAYVVNDTGVAAIGLAFGLAVTGIFYLPLLEPEPNSRSSRTQAPRPATGS